MDERAALRGNSVAAGVIAALWILLAWSRPDATFHVAPVLVAGSLPIVHRIRSGPLETEAAAVMAVVGIFTVVVVTLGLAWADKLQGPTLLPFGGPAVEAALFGLGGGVVGAAIASFEG